jgi:hypothetical protein
MGQKMRLETTQSKYREICGLDSLNKRNLPLLNFQWVNVEVFGLAAGVKGGRSPAQRTLDAGCQPSRSPSWPMRHADALAMTSRSDSYA